MKLDDRAARLAQAYENQPVFLHAMILLDARLAGDRSFRWKRRDARARSGAVIAPAMISADEIIVFDPPERKSGTAMNA